MSIPKGSLVITDGYGKVKAYPPGQNNQILIVDDQEEFKVKYIDISSINALTGPTGSIGPTGPIGPVGPGGPTGSSTKPEIRFVFNGFRNTTYNSFTQFNTSSYRSVCDFYYPGSNYYGGLPTVFSVIAATTANNRSFSVQIVDITNASNVIATITVTGTSSTSLSTYTTTSFSNISTNAAIWELQILGNGGSNTTTNLYSAYISLL